jgi:hypothetical protein
MTWLAALGFSLSCRIALREVKAMLPGRLVSLVEQGE